MKHFLLLLFSIVLSQSIFGQCKFIVVQEGEKCELMDDLAVYGLDSSPYQPQRLNDSTLEFTFNFAEPVYLFVLIDGVRHGDTSLMRNWRTRMWVSPEIKERELIINYATKTVKVKDFTKWGQATQMDGKSKMTVNSLPEWDSICLFTDKLYYSERDTDERNVETSYIIQHPDSYLSLWFFGHSHPLYLEGTDKRLALFNTLNPDLKKYPGYKENYNQIMAEYKRKYPNVGNAFMEFTLTDVKGKVFNSTSIKNKWILLHFWCNCCGPCVREMDSMVSYYSTLDTSKIVFISIALDNDKGAWRKAPATQKIKWINLWEPDNFYGDLCLNYNLPAMPFFVLFNSEKKIVVMQDGADALDTTIKGYLKEVK